MTGEQIRYRNLDIAKGICMICMILTHISGWTSSFQVINKYTSVFFLIFYFINSGLLYKSGENFKYFFRKMARKLLIPYIVLTILYFLYFEIVNRNYVGNSLSEIIYRCLVSLILASPAWIQEVSFFYVDSISVGPIWFWSCMFFTYILYFYISKSKWKLYISVILAIVASISMKNFILPFNLQCACVGCMFFAIGDCFKKAIFRGFDFLKQSNIWHNIIIFSLGGSMYYLVINKLPYQWMNMGENQYFMISIISSLLGCITLMTVIEIIEKLKFCDNVLEYIGINSMFILMLHHIDIMMFRDWGKFTLEANQLAASCILGYLFITILYEKFAKREKMCE